MPSAKFRLKPQRNPGALDDLVRGRAALSQGRYALAGRLLSRAIDTGLGTLTQTQMSRAYFLRGGVLQRVGRFQAAIADYDLAVILDPDFAPAFVDRGIVHYWLGQYTLALADYGRALSRRPDYDIAYINRGNALQKISAYDHAIEDYDRALALNPNAVTAYTGRAAAQYRNEAFSDSIIDYGRALILETNRADALWGRGMARYNLGLYNGAEKDFGILLDQDQTSVYAALWRYLSGRRATVNNRAIAELGARSYGFTPSWPTPIAAFFLGRLTEAELLANAFSADPIIRRTRLTEALFSLGLAALHDGNATRAKHYLEDRRDFGQYTICRCNSHRCRPCPTRRRQWSSRRISRHALAAHLRK